jgi:hypothetical protein
MAEKRMGSLKQGHALKHETLGRSEQVIAVGKGLPREVEIRSTLAAENVEKLQMAIRQHKASLLLFRRERAQPPLRRRALSLRRQRPGGSRADDGSSLYLMRVESIELDSAQQRERGHGGEDAAPSGPGD